MKRNRKWKIPTYFFREMNLVLKKGFIKTTDPLTTDLPTHRPLLTTYPPAHRPLTHQFMLKQKTRSYTCFAFCNS